MTTLDGGYQGWTNIETWNAQLWIANTESIYKLITLYLGISTTRFADNLEGFLWIIWDGTTPDGHSLKPVNWVEIATVWQEDFADT